jgi:hypothetical protein
MTIMIVADLTLPTYCLFCACASVSCHLFYKLVHRLVHWNVSMNNLVRINKDK